MLQVRSLLAAIAGLLLLAISVQAQLPAARLFWLFPTGGKPGSTVEVLIGGQDLEDAAKLHFSHPGLTAIQKTVDPGPFQKGPQPVGNTFLVTVAANVPPGLYEVRAIGKYGISNPRTFVVGDQPEITEKEPNNLPEQSTEVTLETVVNGQANAGADVDFYRFAAKAGQRILIDCQANRIDSKLEPVLLLYDVNGIELDRQRFTSRRDALLDFSVPADGMYFLKLHDFFYNGGPDYTYRLSLGTRPQIDFIFPPAGLPGTTGSFTLYGRNLPGGVRVEGTTLDGKPLEKLQVQIALPGGPAAQELSINAPLDPADSVIDGMEYRITAPQGTSNSILVSFATGNVVPETEPNNAAAQAQKVTVPCEVAGQFYPRRDKDWVAFDAKAGEIVWIEVFSHRLGLPSDPYLLVQQVTKNEKGEEQLKDLGSVDDLGGNIGGFYYDTTTDDPGFRLAVPADGTYRVMVRENGAASDPRLVYRLSLRKESPDFRLVAMPRQQGVIADPNQNQPVVWSTLLRKGGTELIDVYAFRRDGFNEPIIVQIEGLPAGVTCAPVTLGPGAVRASLVLSAADNAADAMGLLNVVGKAKIAGADVARTARLASPIWNGAINQVLTRARVMRNLAVAVSGETAAFRVDAGDGQPQGVSRAGKLVVPVKVTRRGEFKGNVALQPVNLPPNVTAGNLNLDANTAEGKLELTINNNAPEGTFSMYLAAITQVSYARNPEAAKLAADQKVELDKIVMELAAALKAATDAKTAADKAATDATAAATAATTALAAAVKAETDAVTAAKVAADKAAAAKTASDQKPDDAALKAAKEVAEKAAAEAAVKAKTAADAKVVAEKAAADAAVKAKTAADAKIAGDKALAEADAKSKAAVAAQTVANTTATNTANAAKPNNVAVAYPSTPITFNITAAPITLAPPAVPAPIKQGAKIELPIAIVRLHGYADTIELSVGLPNGVAGLKIPNLVIAAGQNEGKLAIEAEAAATVGKHELTVRATAKLNNQSLVVTQVVPLTIEAAQK